MKIIVSFSGGKDSQACLIQATKQYGADKIEAVFCDTGWEHPDTYQHITDTCSQMGVKLTTLKSKHDFVSLAVYKICNSGLINIKYSNLVILRTSHHEKDLSANII